MSSDQSIHCIIYGTHPSGTWFEAGSPGTILSEQRSSYSLSHPGYLPTLALTTEDKGQSGYPGFGLRGIGLV